jgi:hypothetical protein
MKPKGLLSFFVTCDIQFSVHLTSFKQYEIVYALYLSMFFKIVWNLRMPQPRPKYVTLLNEIEFACV